MITQGWQIDVYSMHACQFNFIRHLQMKKRLLETPAFEMSLLGLQLQIIFSIE